ncbi:HTTM domain-containing protein [Taibaiella sp. KBW10]|nr:HTTM domain-containing protein [Taibaiella sp. KBW10]
MIVASMLRFFAKGWIETLYINPGFYFKYYGFNWVSNWGNYTYWLFAICGISALSFALGLFYRISAVVLFLSFTYIELLDKTNYLNHYYFVSLVLFLMIFLPAHSNLALDNIRKPATQKRQVPLWTTASIRLLLGIVYVYAGLAKLNSDWLLEAMPLKLWLPAKNDLPLLGNLLNKTWVAYFFSWFGAAYDLSIPWLLFYKRTRIPAYLTVIAFHIATAILFPIGMFPYVMILSTLIFFPSAGIDAFWIKIKAILPSIPLAKHYNVYHYHPLAKRLTGIVFILFFTIQALLPWRYLCYKGTLFWTEEGYRFSWRVMLMEKMGYAQFVVKEEGSDRRVGINNNEFLSPNQEKMMSTQADFILQYAHFLAGHYKSMGWKNPKVHATIHVSVNGRRSVLYIDPNRDLAQEKDNFTHKDWITPFNDIIYGL